MSEPLMNKNQLLSIFLILAYMTFTVALVTSLFLSTTQAIVKSFAQGIDYPITITNESQEEAQRNRFSAQGNVVEMIHSTNGSIKTNIGSPTNITANSQEDLIRQITGDIRKQLQTNIDKIKQNGTVQIRDQVTGEVISAQIESTNDTELTELITKWLQKGPPLSPGYNNNSSNISSTSKITPSSLPREEERTDNILSLVQYFPYYPQTYCDPRFSYWQPHYYGEWQQLSPGYWTYNINWYWHYHCNGYD